MNRNYKLTLPAIIALLLLLALIIKTNSANAAKEIILSGATAFIADENGTFGQAGTDRWNTLGGDQIGNLWIAPGSPIGNPDGLKKKFINGSTDAQANISIKLVSGIKKFTIYGNDGTPIYYHGLNLFFDSNTEVPRISVYAPTRTSLAIIPVFSTNNSTQTFGLEPSVFEGVIVPASGTTIYSNNGLTVELKEFFFAEPDVFQTDRTRSLPENPGGLNLLNPDGKREFIGSFILEVTAAPTENVLTTLKQLKDRIFTLLLEKHIKIAGTKLHGIATRLLSFGENWEKAVKKSGENSKDAKKWQSKVKSDFATFSKELDNQIKKGTLDDTAFIEITSLRDQLNDAGL